MAKMFSTYITEDEEFGQSFPFFLNSFGYFEDFDRNATVTRPLGRKDYQILYVSNGKLTVNKKNIKNGEFYVLVPNEPQQYTYHACEDSRYYWIHFSGNKVEEILKFHNISHGVNMENGLSSEIETIFHTLFFTNGYDNDKLNKARTSLVLSLLPLLGTEKIENIHFYRAQKLLSDTTNNDSIEDLAKMYNITTEHFIRSFKAVYGKTPSNYRISSRINQAKALLVDTKFSISDIADLCSFNDPYYFSKSFKKHVGLTPMQYRKKFKIIPNIINK